MNMEKNIMPVKGAAVDRNREAVFILPNPEIGITTKKIAVG